MINSNQASASVTFNFIQLVKLDRSNYLVWKAQVRASIIANGLEGFVTGDSICPDRYLNLTEGESSSSAMLISQRQENPEYIVWMKTDKLLQSWMLSSMVDNVLIMVINCESSLELWKRLGQIFMSQSKARFLPLKLQIQSTKKGSLSVSDYFNKMKKIGDSLAIGGNALSSNELIMHLLTGLDDSCESLVTNILTRLEKEELTVEEVYSMLLSHETRLEMSKGKLQNELMHDMTANFAQKGQNHNKNNFGTQKNNNSGGNFGGFTGGYGDNRNNFAGFSPGRDIVCQICFIPGHSAYKCKNKFNQGTTIRVLARVLDLAILDRQHHFKAIWPIKPQASSILSKCQSFKQTMEIYHHGVFPGSTANPMFAGQATSSAPIATYGTVADSAWYLDSGATNHVTQDPGIFVHCSAYFGNDKLHVGNGMGLAIESIGSAVIQTLFTSYLYLNNILLVPAITKNLLSISKLLADNNAFIEFYDYACLSRPRVQGSYCSRGLLEEDFIKLKIFLQSVIVQSFQFLCPVCLTHHSSSSLSSHSISPQVTFTLSESAFPLGGSALQSSPAVDLLSPSSSLSSPEPNTQSQSTPSTLNHHLSPPPQLVQGHPMVTRSKAGIFKPKTTFLTTSSSPSHEPYSISEALADPKWLQAMKLEYQALMDNKTWTLVQPSFPVKIIGSKWVYRIKYNPDGSISRYKARLVDINNAFLNGHLTEEAPRAWFDKLKQVLTAQWGFQNSKSDTSLFFKKVQSHLLLVLVYVDDIIVTGSSSCLIQQVISNLQSTFALKDLGELNYFLGIQVVKNSSGLHLSQSKYIVDLLHKVNLQDCTPCSTPMAAGTSLTKSDSELFDNATLYRSTIGALQYATLTRPKIAFSVNKLGQFLAAPTVNHWQACKRILRYLKGTLHLGLQFYSHGVQNLDCFSDADWASDKDDRRSITGYCVFLGPNLVSWCSKKQAVVSRSSTESEYRALALAASEVLWIKSLLTELGVSLISTPVIWCDNQSAAALTSNPKFHARTKHIELDVHFFREKVANQSLQVSYIPSSDNTADILTKALAHKPFHYLCSKLNLSSPGWGDVKE
ncbi:retrovirus-related pol polyprotein from transposon RE1 [Citrus sinensis]|uniref:Retrovirus-related pol polyprotein from transposon RE1 n=1 Tax=Citrus sinensis TaxID=2711 RepID=A0ACB8JVS3_CITSI|nr:retrovirus-related pol polyprotein from transposon RE1 [Citrus sinensis]